MQIASVSPSELFVATPAGDAQVLTVTLDAADAGETITVRAGESVLGTAPAAATRIEVPLVGLIGRPPGEVIEAGVEFGGQSAPVRVEVAEPGWTVWMIPHFHYDPVWWNTQAAYTATWDEIGGAAQQFRATFQQTGFALVAAHLDVARRDPDYRFVLAEVDYLKPYWDARPGDRALLRRLIADGRVEIMGGTYNEPNTNLTTAETTARNFVYGEGFQRAVLGADPRTAWQLDVFGHDPQFPGMAADAGLTSSSWARGPHHQWGPMLTGPHPGAGWGDPGVMQFPAEFEWISPSGRGVLTHYMPAHYAAGWQIDSTATLAEAEQAVYDLFLLLKRVAATRNVLLPVGTDYTPPSKWVTEIQRDWNARYAWPRFECAIPRQFFAAVRAELEGRGRRPAPQTRDMNPVYTGKDVSYIDTKQAQRAAESLLVDAEMFASFAALHGAHYPHAALDKAWRQLVYGAHHDAITGSESDQVYIDLLTGWREAHDIGREVLQAALDHLADPGAITVFNPSAWSRADLVTVPIAPEAGARDLEVVGPDGAVVPSVVDHVVRRDDGTLASAEVSFVADAPGIGHRRGWRVRPASSGRRWQPAPGTVIESDRYLVEVDPDRGGCVARVYDKVAGREVLSPGEVGNELVVEQEYPEHPEFHEGPWHLVPTGHVLHRASDGAAESVVREVSPLGQRLTVTGRLGPMRYTQRITVRDGADRIDCRTSLDGFDGADQLVRVRWPADVPGALPVSDVGNAVVGRGFAFTGTDAAQHPWTLDNPAVNWFALSHTARVRISAPGGDPAVQRAVGVAELVAADHAAAADLRELAVALVGQGVTATTSIGTGARYGSLAVDSNLPDVRISVGGPEENAFTAAVLDAADEQYRTELDKQLATTGTARVWVPAERPVREVWQPGADLTGPSALPVLIVVGDDELRALARDLGDAVVDVVQLADAGTAGEAELDDYTVAVLNTGLPSFAVDTGGALSMAVLRSCTGWPSGVWINPPRRTAPDGSNFQQQHWTHHFDYALLAGAGDWRRTGLVRAGQELTHPLRTSSAGGKQDGAGLPATHRYLDVDGDGEVLVTAVKAAGNPLAQGGTPGPVDALTVRLVEARGNATTCRVASSFPLHSAETVDLIERPRDVEPLVADDGSVSLDLGPMDIRTVRLDVSGAEASSAELGPSREPHQPVYARYWLNNTGPAPMGNLPVTVHVEPPLVECPAPGAVFALSVRVASDRTDATVDVPLRVDVPDGWQAVPELTPVRLGPGESAEQDVTITVAEQAAAGTWWVRAQAVSDHAVVEDVTRVLIGAAEGPELSVAITGPGPLRHGETGAVELSLTSTARTEVSAQVQLVSPWHTWELLPHWNTGAAVPSGAQATVSFPVHVPPGAPTGRWWALVKVACAGVPSYSEPVELVVR